MALPFSSITSSPKTFTRTLLALVFLFTGLTARGQSPTPRPQASPTTVPALFLSDIHLDPYADPAKVAKLNAAAAAEWGAILGAPASPTQQQDFAALQKACSSKAADTSNVLWLSSLRAIRADAARVKFVTISGDLLAHGFDCKYKNLNPAATHTAYLGFVDKTIRYVVSSLRASLPGVPIYVALGNNDSGCTDYQLAADHDEFLAMTAKIVAETLPADLPAPEREGILTDFATGGYYSAPLPAAVPGTRIIVLDDLFLSSKYATCAGPYSSAPAIAQLKWLSAQLAAARVQHRKVWVLGHIPPGVDMYSTARHFTNVCGGGKPTMFLASEQLAEVLAANSDVIALALFGHTHSDEMRLLAPGIDTTQADASGGPGVPVKLTASITPVNGNRPTFALASIDPKTATLADYTVFMASNLTGVAATWSKEYTYSIAYHQAAFSGADVTKLIAEFQADRTGSSPVSQSYQRNYFPGGDAAGLLQFVWKQYACSMSNDSAQAFAACSCASAK